MLLDYIAGLLDWCKVKLTLQNRGSRPFFREGEIWWCHIGLNIGVEIYGKSITFSRPVLILRKFSKNNFLATPLTSKEKNGSWFAPVTYGNKTGYAILNQARVLDGKRLISRIGVLSEVHLKETKLAFHGLICK